MKLGAGKPHREQVQPLRGCCYRLPAGGWLESIELRPRSSGPNGMLANMDARERPQLHVELLVDGRPLDCDVLVTWREVETSS
jgi:hypothetical protein